MGKSLLIPAFAALLFLLLAGCAGRQAAPSQPTPSLQAGASPSANSSQYDLTVPPKYQSLYNQLNSDLDNFNSSLDSHGPAPADPNLIFATDLLPANGNRGSALLTPGAMQGTTAYLDRLKELGVGGVVVAIKYPLLSSNYSKKQEYLVFYKQVFNETRKRGMKIIVETGPMFNMPEFGDTINYKSPDFSLQTYEAGEKGQIQTIITELKPDYLTVANEPDTYSALTGLKELNTPAGFTGYVSFILDGLDRGNTVVGAGTGSWSSPAFISDLASNTSVDYIDLHIYPTSSSSTNFLDQADQMAGIAKQNGKKLAITEAWLNKERPNELGAVAGTPAIFQRDVFGFWAPLDQKEISTVSKFARQNQMQFVSFFWADYFFAYLNYSDSLDSQPYEQVMEQENQQQSKNIVDDMFSPTGEGYKETIASSK
jgi:hypothetical protein